MPTEKRTPLIKRGSQARRAKDVDGKRLFVPWQVAFEVQMSPLAIALETLIFYVMQQDGEKAVQAAGMLLRQFYRFDRKDLLAARGMPDDGFPKPVGLAAARQITDKEFASKWKQALHERKEILFGGEKSDPLAFHTKRSTDKKIIII